MCKNVSALLLEAALAVHAVAAPLIFAAISAVYFRRPAFIAPVVTAAAFVVLVLVMDVVIVAVVVERSFAMFTSVVGTWLPLASIFGVTWLTGVLVRSRARAYPPCA